MRSRRLLPSPPRRRGVLLLVVLSMLTLFMLLGVTYLVLAARTRATSRAFLRLEDDLTANALKVKPLIREAALQVIRGTHPQNASSVIRYHDLLADRYGPAGNLGLTNGVLVAPSTPANAGALVRFVWNGSPPAPGRVLTFTSGPDGVKNTSVRIADVQTTPNQFLWVPRPAALKATDVGSITSAIVNGAEYDGKGFNGTAQAAGTTDLNDAALMPNRSLAFSTTTFEAAMSASNPFGTNSAISATQAHEDYDAVDEQNMALAWPDGSAQSFVRPGLVDVWVRDYLRRQQFQGLPPTFSTQPELELELRRAILQNVDKYDPPRNPGPFSSLAKLQQAQVIAIHALRRASMRPFAYDHWQDDARTVDFAGRPYTPPAIAPNPRPLYALAPTTLVNGREIPLGDVDNDGDGVKESVWLDLGMGVRKLGDGKAVKPLFAIHCIDLGGRVALNANGSPVHAAESAAAVVLSDPSLAPRRKDDGSAPQKPSTLRGGLGFGPADVRLDRALDPATQRGVMFGLPTPSAAVDGLQRDTGPVVGRYGDKVGSDLDPAFPGVPWQNDRRVDLDGSNVLAPETTTDRGLPVVWKLLDGGASPLATAGLFGGAPPDPWARWSVGVDHRGQPSYVNRTPTWPVAETTDNPYELDLLRPRQGIPYVQSSGPNDTSATVDQPFTASELEAILRPYDVDNAMSLPPRLLSLAAAAPGGIDTLRFAVTTDNWDTPGVIGFSAINDKLNRSQHDPDLVSGLRMDLNRPFGDAFDNDGDGVVDEPRESLDAAAATPPRQPDAFGGVFTSLNGSTSPANWLLTRGEIRYGTADPAIPAQAGREEPHLRARQLFAHHLFNLARTLKDQFATRGTGSALRLFAVQTDVDDNSQAPVAMDAALNAGSSGDRDKQDDANDQALAQWAVNVVDFMDPDAIMTPFTFRTRAGVEKVVWGCEFPDVMITETLAFHDRRTADTKGDPTGETTVNFFTQYKTVYDAWVNGGRTGPQPDPQDPDNNPDTDDGDFDQVRIPEGSLFLELHCLRNPRSPSLPRELYSWDAAKAAWYLDVGRVPAGGVDPVWRLSIADTRIENAANDVFKQIDTHRDTTPLLPGATAGQVAGAFPIDRFVWLSPTAPPPTGAGATLDNTFYRRDASLPPPKLAPGGYLVIGPRPTTAIGSIDNGAATVGQKWGVPSKQQIELDAFGTRAVTVTDLKGSPSPGVSGTMAGATFGNPLPPTTLPETAATWLSMEPPASWTTPTNLTIGLNVSAPLRSTYYPQPTVDNPASGLKDAYGNLASDNHGAFRNTPLDRAPTAPISRGKLLSGGSYANYKNVFVERLADPTRPYEPDTTSTDWNPYIVVDFMPIDLTVFNGESTAQDPSETQGRDRGLAGDLPAVGTSPGPVDPTTTPPPLPIADSATLARRHTFFHSRQRGFGVDLPDYDNDRTLFGVGTDAIQRNAHPFKPIGGMDDLKPTPLTTSADSTALQPGGRPTTPRSIAGLAADEKACFLHELGQGPAGRTTPSDWKNVPYHSLGWVNSSFGRRLDAANPADGIPAGYTGAPDRPFPWLVWNDRPFANVAELAFVPMTPPGRLLSNYRNFDYPSPSKILGSTNYPPATYPDYPNAATPYNKDDMYGACTPGAHLLPMTSLTDIAAPGATRTRSADLFCRLFDLVRVRSPFMNTEIALKGIASPTLSDGRSDMLLAPFNRIPTWREPGRININTIPPDPLTNAGLNLRQKIWSAVCADTTGTAAPLYADVVATTTGTLTFPGSPAVTGTFSRPFRTSAGDWKTALFGNEYRSNAYLPLSCFTNPPASGPSWVVSMPASGPAPTPTINDRFAPRAATLLRDQQVPSGIAPPLFAAAAPDAWANDPARNAWFRFESLVRAHTNTTVRSELYAIWVTVGLFEVTADTTQVFDPSNELVPLYPDGYRLVREYGSDSGDVTRHRGFYIFDRSVPVGYQTGSDLNVKDGILVERFIE